MKSNYRKMILKKFPFWTEAVEKKCKEKTVTIDGVIHFAVPAGSIDKGVTLYKRIDGRPFIVNHHNSAAECKKHGYRADGHGEVSISPDDDMNHEMFLRDDSIVYMEGEFLDGTS